MVTALITTKQFQPKYQMSRGTIQICFSGEGKTESPEMDISLIRLSCLTLSLAWDDKRFVCLLGDCWRSISFFTWRWGKALQHENQNLKRHGYKNGSFDRAMCTDFNLCSLASIIVHSNKLIKPLFRTYSGLRTFYANVNGLWKTMILTFQHLRNASSNSFEISEYV